MNKILKIVPLTFILINFASAKEASIGRIAEIHGSGFISQNGETHEMRKGVLVYPNSEIVLEHSGFVTYSDNADHQFHLSNSASFVVTKTGAELRSGNVWFQSLNKTENYSLNTANGIVDFQGGEGIITYDSTKGKTQLMVINGMMKLSNLKVRDLNIAISEGNFSYIDNNYDEGAPRDPTPVGEKTYKNLISEFTGIKPMDKNSANVFKANDGHGAKREIASVHEVPKEEVSHHADVAKAEIKLDPKLEEYKNSMLEKKSNKVIKKVSAKVYHKTEKKFDKEASPLIVQIFGQKAKLDVSNRAPASVSVPAEAIQEKNVIKTDSKIENKTSVPTKETEKLLESLNKL